MKRLIFLFAFSFIAFLIYMGTQLNNFIDHSKKFEFVNCNSQESKITQTSVLGDCWQFEDNKFIYINTNDFDSFRFELPAYKSIDFSNTLSFTTDLEKIELNPMRRVKQNYQSFDLQVIMDTLTSDSIGIFFHNNFEILEKLRTEDLIQGKVITSGLAIGDLKKDRYDLKLDFYESSTILFKLQKISDKPVLTMKRIKKLTTQHNNGYTK